MVNGVVWGGVRSSEGGGVDAGVVLCMHFPLVVSSKGSP